MTVSELHNQAIDLADQGFFYRSKGDLDKAVSFFEQAFEKERSAAIMAADQNTGQPTQSILFRSAASLAILSNNFAEAEHLIQKGLDLNPPAEIVEELKALYENESFNQFSQSKNYKSAVSFPRIFISYHFSDSEAALELVENFSNHNFNVIINPLHGGKFNYGFNKPGRTDYLILLLSPAFFTLNLEIIKSFIVSIEQGKVLLIAINHYADNLKSFTKENWIGNIAMLNETLKSDSLTYADVANVFNSKGTIRSTLFLKNSCGFDSRGNRLHKLKAKDSTGRWAYYFVLVDSNKEDEFEFSLQGDGDIDLSKFGEIISASYEDFVSQPTLKLLRERYNFSTDDESDHID